VHCYDTRVEEPECPALPNGMTGSNATAERRVGGGGAFVRNLRDHGHEQETGDHLCPEAV
jgi:hypothetical protein